MLCEDFILFTPLSRKDGGLVAAGDTEGEDRTEVRERDMYRRR